MAEILLSRYDLFISKTKTHITTNLSATEIEKKNYGNRVRSRLREMVNLIAFENQLKTKDKMHKSALQKHPFHPRSKKNMNTITNFWNYFQQTNFVFLLLNEIPKTNLKTHFDKLIEILHQYNKDLNLIIKNKTKGGELIITANGNPYLFKEVELLVHHAPVVERWKITAFLQPETNLTKYENGTDKPLEYYGIIFTNK